MLKSLASGVSGVRNFQNQIDVIGNNIANVNTTGFKSARVDFADTFSQAIKGGSTDGNSGSVSQIGSGVTSASVRNLFSSGSLTETGLETDFAILGEGFFSVKEPDGDTLMATRAGNFRVDGQGFLTTSSGHRLQGSIDAAGQITGDINVKDDPNNRPQGVDQVAESNGHRFSNDGKIYIQLDNGEEYVKGQILLQRFDNPSALAKVGDNLYTNVAEAGPLGGATPKGGTPGSAGLGAIQSGALELSNVDLTNEFASLIASQRSFQANARMITTSDEMLQEVVNLKR
ncbi:MAG: flagellar hook-basal body complex protein [Verrucomicrobia bacterium]|jgi:flagellar hook protein FlgE|nr:flagellar hook-basal body complex protein [Verrucomicrobiota bacterium]